MTASFRSGMAPLVHFCVDSYKSWEEEREEGRSAMHGVVPEMNFEAMTSCIPFLWLI